MPQINVRLKNHSYPVLIGYELDSNLVRLIKKQNAGNRVFVFFDATVYALYGKQIESQLSGKRIAHITFVVPGGEKSKSQVTLNKIYDFLLSEQVSRTDLLLAVGGGVITDLVGFAAATILRGVKWGTVSTTLLGMVDAAIGGKTGINHIRGKNMIGAFCQPAFVICDLKYLNTLPHREIIAGLGEILKYAGLTGAKISSILKSCLNSANLLNFKTLQRLIQLSVEYKAKIVMADERESNKRMFLNLGHTFAHAIEKTLGYGRLLHGESVIIGLLAAVILSKKVNPRSVVELINYENLIKNLLARVHYYQMTSEKVLNEMKLDKKRVGQVQKFVLLNRPGKPFIVSGLKKQIVKEALDIALADYKEFGVKNG